MSLPGGAIHEWVKWAPSYFHLVIDGAMQYFMHTSGFFGAKALPFAWCRISAFINTILAVRFAVCTVVHMDDQIGIDPADASASAIVCMRRVASALGFHLKLSKEKLPSRSNIALGVHCLLLATGEKHAKISLPKQKTLTSTD